jgi:hypothetical protein
MTTQCCKSYSNSLRWRLQAIGRDVFSSSIHLFFHYFLRVLDKFLCTFGWPIHLNCVVSLIRISLLLQD